MDVWDYRRAIHDTVCGRCLDGDGRGNCRIDPVHECTIQKYLPLIVDIVKSVQSDDMNAYVRALRNAICDRCRYQTVSGYCTSRTTLDCALDRYLTLVVETISDVEEEEEPRRISC